MEKQVLNDLKNMRILVTGGTGHLGREISIGLARLSVKVLINGRSHNAVAKLVNKIKQNNLKAEAAIFDVRDKNQINIFFKNFKGPLNSVISNAYSGKLGTIQTLDSEEYLKSLEISVVAAHNLILKALPYLKKSIKKTGNASFINIASMYGVTSPDIGIYKSRNTSNPPTYGVAKAGLIQWTKYAALEFGKYGIRVNCISPGPFPKDKSDKEFIKTLSGRTGLKRIGSPKELVGPVSFLCSKVSSFITGENIMVDGGWTAR